eukprot:6183922-Pleurochrysis_carterae.AAC.1
MTKIWRLAHRPKRRVMRTMCKKVTVPCVRSTSRPITRLGIQSIQSTYSECRHSKHTEYIQPSSCVLHGQAGATPA